MTDDTTPNELDEAVERRAMLIPAKRPVPPERNEHEELLDARDVVEAADELVNLYPRPRWAQWQQRDADAMSKLCDANRRYWEKWGEKK